MIAALTMSRIFAESTPFIVSLSIAFLGHSVGKIARTHAEKLTSHGSGKMTESVAKLIERSTQEAYDDVGYFVAAISSAIGCASLMALGRNLIGGLAALLILCVQLLIWFFAWKTASPDRLAVVGSRRKWALVSGILILWALTISR